MQPRRPQVHSAPPILTTTWPSSPAAPRPSHGSPWSTRPPPTPVPHQTPSSDFERRPAPSAYSALTPTVTSLSTYARVSASVLNPAATGIGAPSPGRFRASDTTPWRVSMAPGEPTPTPARSPISTPASAQADPIVETSARITSCAPSVVGGARRACPIAARRRSSTTAWIFVPPRSSPPTRRRRGGLIRPFLPTAGVNAWYPRLLVGPPGDRNPGVVLGVDVGGTKVAVAAVDGVTVREAAEDPTSTDTTEALLDGVEAVVQRMIDQVGRPEAIGVGVPSQIEYDTGTVETSVNIPLAGVPLREELGRRFGAPVFVDNDANCAALAEAHILGEDDLVMLTLGTGVGGGIVTGGESFPGAPRAGARGGGITLNPDGPPCPGNCPNRGCLEAYCSGQALERDATELATDKPDSHLATLIGPDGKVSGREVV